MKYRILAIISVLYFTGCNKEDENNHPCYDSSIVHDNPCPMDCPGIEGCDGKTYCNGCEAARQGIGPK